MTAMSEGGFVGVMIPEEYGGSGGTLKQACDILEEVCRAGCNGSAVHAQMYTMASILFHGTDGE